MSNGADVPGTYLGGAGAAAVSALQTAHSRLQDKMYRVVDAAQCRQLEATLNKMINELYDNNPDDYRTIFNALLQRVDPGTNYRVGTSLNVVDVKTEAQFKKEYDELKQKTGLDWAQLKDDPRFASIFNKMKKSYGGNNINKIKGDFFEAFLQMAVPQVLTVMNDGIDTTADVEIENLIKNFKGDILSSKAPIKTAGSQQRKIEYNFGRENEGIYSSYQKTDVSISLPWLGNLKDLAEMAITAKNYKDGKSNIELLKDANLYGMVYSWDGVNKVHQETFLSALTYYDADRLALVEKGYTLLRDQALIGTGLKGQEQLSDFIIVNNRANKNSIKILPTYSIISKDIDNLITISPNQQSYSDHVKNLVAANTPQARTLSVLNKAFDDTPKVKATLTMKRFIEAHGSFY